MKSLNALLIALMILICQNLKSSSAEDLLREPRFSQIMDSLQVDVRSGSFINALLDYRPVPADVHTYIELYFERNDKAYREKRTLRFHVDDKIVKEIVLPQSRFQEYKISRNAQYCAVWNTDKWDLYDVTGSVIGTINQLYCVTNMQTGKKTISNEIEMPVSKEIEKKIELPENAEPLPTKENDITALQKGVTIPGGELHLRGGRNSDKYNYTLLDISDTGNAIFINESSSEMFSIVCLTELIVVNKKGKIVYQDNNALTNMEIAFSKNDEYCAILEKKYNQQEPYGIEPQSVLKVFNKKWKPVFTYTFPEYTNVELLWMGRGTMTFIDDDLFLIPKKKVRLNDKYALRSIHDLRFAAIDIDKKLLHWKGKKKPVKL